MNRKKKVVVPIHKTESSSELSDPTDFLAGQFARGGDYSKPVTIMLLEVDDFTGMNRVFGAKRCGRMLREVASILNHSLRGSDLVTFYGKGRFCLVLKGAGPRSAQEVGERIRAAVKDAAFAPEHGHVLKISVSCGHATQTEGADFKTPDDLVAAALKCLHEAIESGEDRVVGYRLPPGTLEFPEAGVQD